MTRKPRTTNAASNLVVCNGCAVRQPCAGDSVSRVMPESRSARIDGALVSCVASDGLASAAPLSSADCEPLSQIPDCRLIGVRLLAQPLDVGGRLRPHLFGSGPSGLLVRLSGGPERPRERTLALALALLAGLELLDALLELRPLDEDVVPDRRDRVEELARRLDVVPAPRRGQLGLPDLVRSQVRARAGHGPMVALPPPLRNVEHGARSRDDSRRRTGEVCVCRRLAGSGRVALVPLEVRLRRRLGQHERPPVVWVSRRPVADRHAVVRVLIVMRVVRVVMGIVALRAVDFLRRVRDRDLGVAEAAKAGERRNEDRGHPGRQADPKAERAPQAARLDPRDDPVDEIA